MEHDDRGATGLSSMVLGELGSGRGGVSKSRHVQLALPAVSLTIHASLATQVRAVSGGTFVRLDGRCARSSVNILDPRVDIWTCGARPAAHTSNDTTEEHS